MKFNNLITIVLTCIILIGLSGCAKYSAKPIKPMKTIQQLKDGTISVSYKVFNAYDCKKYLGRNTIAKGFQPIQVTITNNTDRYFTILPDSFNCDCISAEEVAQEMHTNTAGRAAGYGTAACILFPILAIPAIVDGVRSSNANTKLDADYHRKSLSTATISPHRTINGLIFISAGDDTHNITTTLVDIANNRSYILSAVDPVVRV